MCEAIRISVRYDTQDSAGETRRERNARFGQESPEVEVPAAGADLYAWFRDASAMRRWDNGYPTVIQPSDWVAWANMMNLDIRPQEWAVLRKMDEMYVSTFIDEIRDNATRLTPEK